MTLKEEKKAIKELLKAKEKDKLIKKLQNCFEDKDKKLEKEFTSMNYETCLDLPKDEKEKFERLEWSVGKSNDYYWVSDLGRVAIGNEEKANKIIPQRQDSEWNWKLDKEKFENENIAGETKVYDFMKETTWLKEEYKEIKEIYLDCELQLHHICQSGDNRIDNMIYLPEGFHNELHHPNK